MVHSNRIKIRNDSATKTYSISNETWNKNIQPFFFSLSLFKNVKKPTDNVTAKLVEVHMYSNVYTNQLPMSLYKILVKKKKSYTVVEI